MLQFLILKGITKFTAVLQFNSDTGYTCLLSAFILPPSYSYFPTAINKFHQHQFSCPYKKVSGGGFPVFVFCCLFVCLNSQHIVLQNQETNSPESLTSMEKISNPEQYQRDGEAHNNLYVSRIYRRPNSQLVEVKIPLSLQKGKETAPLNPKINIWTPLCQKAI